MVFGFVVTSYFFLIEVRLGWLKVQLDGQKIGVHWKWKPKIVWFLK